MQQRRLVRARTLAGFRDALIARALAGPPLSVRRRLVIVPTRAAAALLRQTIESRHLHRDGAALLLPDIVTRDEWLQRLRAAAGLPRWASRIEREWIMRGAAAAAAARLPGRQPPFALRPALIAAMLDFYDELRRRRRTIRRFARSLFDELRVERATDRGSESLIAQTVFLGFAFLGYQRRLAAGGGVDEHVLRDRILASPPALPFDHVLVAVADHPADLRGLWTSDFELLSRLTGIAELDLVMTDEMHDAGFRDRAEHELPGIVEERADAGTASRLEAPLIQPPAAAPGDLPIFLSRDREDEVRDVIRAIRGRAVDGRLAERAAVVFHRPLPYLYVAPPLFAAAAVPFEAWDALPLAIEPYAALVDLLMTCAVSGATRESVAAVLRSPLVRVAAGVTALDSRDVAALEGVLAAQRTAGSAETFAAEVAAFFAGRSTRDDWDAARAARAAAAAAQVRDHLQGLRSADAAADQVRALAEALRALEAPVDPSASWFDRHQQARAAVLTVLAELELSCRLTQEPGLSPEELTEWVRHALEARTFVPQRDADTTARGTGLPLVDVMAARFTDVDHLHLVGLVEPDWSEGSGRTIFYTSGLLKNLGWPQETERVLARQAAFRDLLGLAAQTTTLHAFQLDGDAVVPLAPLAEAAAGRSTIPLAPPRSAFTFVDESLADRTVDPAALIASDAVAAPWLSLRLARPPLSEPAYAGVAGPQAPRPYRVSRIDRFVACPFKYFAESVLQLPEERDDVSGLTPLERGSLVHELFQRFFAEWHAGGRRAITVDNLPAAMTAFAALTAAALSRYPAPDRALERTRLLGSIVATGLAERVFQLEADAGGVVVDRLLEVPLAGVFRFPHEGDPVAIEIRGKADRIDVLEGDRLRVIDYKLGRLPDVDTALQIGVYAHCAAQELTRRTRRRHDVAAAMYLAFGDERRLDGPLGSADEPVGDAVLARARAFAGVVATIERGEYPVQPLRPGDCVWCGFAGLCRKEFTAAKDDDAADVV